MKWSYKVRIALIVAERLVMKGFTHEHAGAWQCEKLNARRY